MSIRHLDALLAPRSVVVVGASDRAGSVGATVWRNVRAGGFRGPVHAVNPHHATLDGEAVFAHCAGLPEVPDLAIVCTPPDRVTRIIDELGRSGTRAAIVLAAGIDAVQAQAIREAARPHLLRVLGPNCLGLLSPHVGLNASLAHLDAQPGALAFVSQSGPLATAMLDWARSRDIGFSHLVSLGDQLDVDFGDMLDYLASDVTTRAILLHVESITSARKFMSAARAAARNKPVIVVKAGRGGNGPRAAAADAVIDAAIRRAGMLRVDTLDELFLAAETLSRFRGDAARGLTLMTNGRGADVMAADEAARLGIDLPELDATLTQALSGVLPPEWSHGNPVDIIGDAPPTRYADTLRLLLARPETGTILFMHAPTAVVRSSDIAQACAPVVQGHADRVLSCWLGDASVADARRVFEAAGIADYATPEQAVRAFAMVATYRRNQALLLECPAVDEAPVRHVAMARRIVEAALAAGREMLDEVEGKALLAAYGIPVAAAASTVVQPDAWQLVVRASVDPVFGPVIMFGQGGTSLEIVADRAFALAPLNRALARDVISRTRVHELLRGYPQHPAARLEAIEDALVAVAQILVDLPEVAALDINPLAANADGVLALDVRLRVQHPRVAGTDRFAILPYPRELEETVDWQGQRVLLRPIRPEDAARHAEFIAHVSPADLRLRFFSSRRELPPTELARLVQVDYAREMAFVAVQDAGQPGARTLGVVRAVSDPDNVDAEFAILARSDLHRRGLGTLLMRKMVDYLRHHGTQAMTGYVLDDNVAMQAFVRRFGFAMQPACKEPGVTLFRLDLQ
jgi:acyl-CoA synthetase (NDP forming)/RimJ/RimL family protein N-acetyltransferase